MELKKYSQVSAGQTNGLPQSAFETGEGEDDSRDIEAELNELEQSVSDGQATGGDDDATEEDIDDVDTDEDIENQAQPDFAPHDSSRKRNDPDDPQSSRGLGAHITLHQGR